MLRAADREAIVEHRKEYDEFPLAWQFERRREYLRGELYEIVCELLQHIECHKRLIMRGCVELSIIEKEEIDRLLKKVQAIQSELIRQRKILEGKEPGITPAMIERARAFPFTQLYEFRRNAALCPFHNDHTPSLILMRDNTARCFGACNASWDTIAFIRDREGLSFPEAVRRLQ